MRSKYMDSITIFTVFLLFTASTLTWGQVLFFDDFQSYDLESPADFSIGSVPTGNWIAEHDPAIARSNEVWDTSNFGRTRMWITIQDGAGIVSRGITGLTSYSDYNFSVVLLAETSSATRTVEVTYDLQVGPDVQNVVSLIGGPISVTAHGDDWQVGDSKADHVFIQKFSTGSLTPGDLLFISIYRISSPEGAYLGVDDIRVAEIQPIQIIASDTTVNEGDSSTVQYDIYIENQPLAPVAVTVTADDQTTVNGQNQVTLIFTPPVNITETQSIIVSAIDDNITEGIHTSRITHTSASADPAFNGLNLPTVEISIRDNDLPIDFVSDVFVGGQEGPDGTSNYRIPAMTVTPDGSILAFAEGRRNGGDPGGSQPIDMVMKRSTDNGRTWQPLVVLHQGGFDYSDPRPVTDWLTGNVHLLYTQWPDLCGQSCVPTGLNDNSSVLFLQTSDDNGQSWSGPINLNPQVKNPAWRALNSGPGHGIQLRWQTDPARNGRLLDPAHINGADAISVFSNDGGISWQAGAADITAPSLNESDVVELTNGDLLWDARPGSGLYRYRLTSSDGGQAWQYQGQGDIHITTVDCGIARYSARRDGHDRDRIVFSGPLGEPLGSASGRYNLAVWTSYDEGVSFTNPIQINNGFAAYSDIYRLADGNIGVIYEETGSTLIRLASCNIDTLENGPHDANLTQYDGFGNAIDAQRGGIGWTGSWEGLAKFSRYSVPAFGSSSIPFPQMRFRYQPGRVDSADNGLNMTRYFNQPFIRDGQTNIYLSILVSRALDVSPDNLTEEDLNIELRDINDTVYASFGIDSKEAFFIASPAGIAKTTQQTFHKDGNWLLVARILPVNNATNWQDTLSLLAIESGSGVIPLDDVGLSWSLTGQTTGISQVALDHITISAGNQALWSIDELRIGTTWQAVTGRPDCSAPGSYLSADLNHDCYVDFFDLALFMQGWLACTDPGNPVDCP